MTTATERVTPTGLLLTSVSDPDDPRWHEARSQGIGSSEIAAVLGISPWDSPLGLWLSKTGRNASKDVNEAMVWGSVLEGPIAEEYGRRNDLQVLPAPGVLRHQDIPFALASPDRLLAAPDDPRPFSFVECKNVSAWKAAGWDGEEGLMPPAYLAQVVWQLGVTGYDEAAVACLVGGQHFESLSVVANPALFEQMVARAEEFWALVQSDTEPPYDSSPLSAQALRGVVAEPDKSMQLDPVLADDLLKRLVACKEVTSAHKKRYEEAKQDQDVVEGEVRALLLDAEYGLVGEQPFFTAKTTLRKGYSVQPTSFRTVRIAK